MLKTSKIIATVGMIYSIIVIITIVIFAAYVSYVNESQSGLQALGALYGGFVFWLVLLIHSIYTLVVSFGSLISLNGRLISAIKICAILFIPIFFLNSIFMFRIKDIDIN